MLGNEDLLAISCLLDSKLMPIREELGEMNQRMDRIEERLNNVESDVRGLSGRMDKLEVEVHSIHVKLDNDICTRLQNIESCYISAADRFRKRADQIDGMQMDIDILKNVATEHSRRLQEIS